MTEPRVQQAYENCLRDSVRRTSDFSLATQLGVHPSTAAGWLPAPKPSVVGSNSLDPSEQELRAEFTRLQRRIGRWIAVLHLLLPLLRVCGITTRGNARGGLRPRGPLPVPEILTTPAHPVPDPHHPADGLVGRVPTCAHGESCCGDLPIASPRRIQSRYSLQQHRQSILRPDRPRRLPRPRTFLGAPPLRVRRTEPGRDVNCPAEPAGVRTLWARYGRMVPGERGARV